MGFSIIYVTEPKAIDLDAVKRALGESGAVVVPGSTAFEGSTDQDFDTLLIRSVTRVDNQIKQHFPHLKNIVRAGAGLDNVDLDYCKQAGIRVFNAPGANADAVSEYVVAVILYVLRKLNKLSEDQVRAWDRFALRGSSIREHTIGIVGFGHIGKLLYEKLNVFSSPKFLVYDPYVTQDSIHSDNIELVSLDDVLKEATIISLHLPLTPETKHIINEQKLSLIQDGSLLINASRGGIVDERAVVTHTSNANLTYIADVVEGEPHVSEELLGNENIIITPQIAALSSFAEQEMICQSLQNFLGGIEAKLLP